MYAVLEVLLVNQAWYYPIVGSIFFGDLEHSLQQVLADFACPGRAERLL